MEQRAFGKTGLRVSALGYGAGQIGDGRMDEKEVGKVLNEILDAGVTLIDTARGYGLSEERIGRHISHRREEYVLSTKVGYSIEGYQDWTYDCIVAGIDHARKLLQSDVLDIVHLHSCPSDIMQNNGVIDALEQAREAGKIRVIAYSGENEDLDYALDSRRFGSLMASLNFCDQRIINKQLPHMQEQGLGFIAKRPIANAPWRFQDRPVGNYAEEYWHRWKTMAIDPGMDWLELAIRFSAFIPGVHSIITGTASLDHFKENIRYMEKGPLENDIYCLIRDAFQTHDQDWRGEI